jgi:hypothetical protein
MKTEIEIWNGSGWNNYVALRQLKTLQIGTRGLLTRNGIRSLEIAPRDSEKPFGIAARYYDADGELVFTQGFDQNDSASWIRERVYALLAGGIRARSNERAREISRNEFVQKITAWRRNFDAMTANTQMMSRGDKVIEFNVGSASRLRAKFGKLRELGGKNISRKTCWNLTYAVMAGEMTYAEAVAKF